MLKIETGTDNEILRSKSLVISKITTQHQALISQMQETMLAEDGVGLAAPQVGHNIRLILTTLSGSKGREVVAMINPEILDSSQKQICLEEGCLSLPGQFAEVSRAEEVTVSYLDSSGHAKIARLKGMNARVVLHELDHLDGILFTDRISEVKSPLQKLKSKLYL